MEWWQRTLRVAEFPLPAFGEELVEAAVSRTKELHFDAVQLGVSEAWEGERGLFHFASKAAGEVRSDFLRPYVEEAHGSGLRVLVTIHGRWLESSFAARHPDWLQRRSDGKAIDDVCGGGCSPCANSPGYRSWSFQLIRDLVRYPIDGIYLDGPSFAPSGCWCEACRARFRERFAKELPVRENWEDAAWKELIELRYDSVADYLRDARAVLKKGRTDAVISMAGQGLCPAWPNGRDNRRLAPHQDIVEAEGCWLAGRVAGESLWRPSMSAKLLETQAAGKPTILGLSGAHPGWDLSCLTAEETYLQYAQAIAHGSSPRYCLPFDVTTQGGAKAAGEMNAFIKRNARFLEGTSPVAEVALLWSARTADYYHGRTPGGSPRPQAREGGGRPRSGDHEGAFLGWFECLTRRHVQFDVLDEQAVEETLERYAVLVLPNVACISQKHAAAITAWVKSGGALVSTFETSLYTDWGVHRSTPALHEVLGISCTGIDGPADRDYLRRAEEPLFASVSSPLVPSPRFTTLVRPASPTARVLSCYRESRRTRSQPLSQRSAQPAIVENRYGAGRSLYFAGTLDEAYRDHHLPEHASLMSWPVDEAAPRHLLLDAPQTVQAVLRRQLPRRRLIVHLVNATGEMTRPIGRIIPVQRLKVALPGVKAASSALFAVPGRLAPLDLPVKARGEGGIEVTVPRLDAYGLLVLSGATLGHLR